MFDKIIHQINRRFGISLDSNAVLGLLMVIGFIAFIWWKYEQAKRRQLNRNRHRNQNPNGNQRNNNHNNADFDLRHSVDEVHELSAKERYLQRDSWKDQSICVCVEQLCDKKRLATDFQFVLLSECVSILKQLVRRHRVHVIHCIPPFIQNQQIVNDELAESKQTPYEQMIVNELRVNGICEAGLPEYKILFCTTKKGKASMVRQLLPTLYMDSDEWVLGELFKHLTEVVQITDFMAGGGVSPTVFVSDTFAAYFQ